MNVQPDMSLHSYGLRVWVGAGVQGVPWRWCLSCTARGCADWLDAICGAHEIWQGTDSRRAWSGCVVPVGIISAGAIALAGGTVQEREAHAVTQHSATGIPMPVLKQGNHLRVKAFLPPRSPLSFSLSLSSPSCTCITSYPCITVSVLRPRDSEIYMMSQRVLNE